MVKTFAIQNSAFVGFFVDYEDLVEYIVPGLDFQLDSTGFGTPVLIGSRFI